MPISPNIAANYAEGVAEVYRDAEVRILQAITRGLAQGLDTPEWQMIQLARLQAVRADVIRILSTVDPIAAAHILADVTDAYQAGKVTMLLDIGAQFPGLTVAPTLAGQAAVVGLVADVQDGIASARPGILRTVDDVYRKVVAKATAGVLTGGSQRGAVQSVLNELLGRGLSAVPTKRGKIGLGDYAMMAVRTATARAAIHGATETMGQAGLDLVVIHPGPRACDICDRWARVILARNGGGPTGLVEVESLTDGRRYSIRVDGTLDDARRANWGHPNCRCGLAAYMPGITKREDIARPPWDEQGYQAQQQQRGIERQIRAWKARQATALDPKDAAQAGAQVRAYQAKMRQHLADNPSLKRQSSREQVGMLTGNTTAARALK